MNLPVHLARARILFALVLLAVTSQAVAQDDQPLRFQTFQPCWGNGDYCFTRVLVEGEIPGDAGRQFETFVQSVWPDDHRAGDKGGRGPTVCFNSPGGSLDGGIELGRTIRLHRMDTCIEPSYSTVGEDVTSPNRVLVPNATCSSACVLAFMGGVNRRIEEGSFVGVHQFVGSPGPLGDVVTQVTQTQLAQHLDAMGVSRRLLDVASLVPPWSIRWLTLDEARSVVLDNMTPRPTAWTLGTNSEGLVFATSSVVRPGPRSSVGVFLFGRKGQPTAYVNFVPGDLDQSAALNALRTAYPVRFLVGGVVIGEQASGNWIAREYPLISIEVPLQATAFDTLAAGLMLEFTVFVANANRQYDPSITLPLSGLAQHLPALVPPSASSLEPVDQSESSADQPRHERTSWSTVLATTWADWSPTVTRGAEVTLLWLGVAIAVLGLRRLSSWLASLFTKPPST